MRVRVAAFFVLCVFSGAMLMACEETVDPITESDRQLTLWGTLDMNADVQYLRVVPIREILDVRLTENPEMDVVSIDLDSGQRTEWRDSTINFSGDRPALIYYANLKVIPGHTYRIEIGSPDYSLITSAQTTIPLIPEADIFEERVNRFVSGTGFSVAALQDVRWSGIGRYPYQIEQWYRFLEFGNLGFIDYLLPFVPPQITYNPGARQLDMSLNLVRHRDSIQKYIAIGQVRLVGLGQTITILDNAFVPPGGVFDAELLAQPGTMSNVEHGFGFFGSVGRFSVEWVIGDSAAAMMRYVPLSGYRLPKNAHVGTRRRATLSEHPWVEESGVQILRNSESASRRND